jgi:hypothetical protein
MIKCLRKNLVSDARKFLGATSVTINEPALELSKNRFDERIILQMQEKD